MTGPSLSSVLPAARARHLLLLLAVLSGALTIGAIPSSGATSEADWASMQRDAANRGFNPVEARIGTDNVAQLRPAWSTRMGVGYGVAISGSRVYGSCHTGTGLGVCAIDAATGNRIWAATVGDVIHPTVAEGAVYVVGEQGQALLMALDAATGATRWSVRREQFSHFFRPTVAAGRVHATGADRRLHTFDSHTGVELWSYQDDPSSDSFVAIGEYTTPAVADGRVYVLGTSRDPGIQALDAATGRRLWFTTAGLFDGAPTVADGRLFGVTSSRGTVSAFKADGCGSPRCAPIWTASLDDEQGAWFQPGLAYGHGMVFATAVNGALYAFDATTGVRRWRTPTRSTSGYLSSVAKGVVYTGTADGAIAAYRSEGCGAAICDPIWTSSPLIPHTGDRVWSPPGISAGAVYVTAPGVVYKFVLPDALGPRVSPPEAPTGVVAEPHDQSILIRWHASRQDGGGPVTRYRVEASDGRQIEVAGIQERADFRELTNGQRYTFTVTAINAAGPGPRSEPSNEASPSTPGNQPRNLRVTAGDGTATVSWDPPEVPSEQELCCYIVRALPDPTCPRVDDTRQPRDGRVDASSTRTTFTGLRNFQTYRFNVQIITGQFTADALSAPATPLPDGYLTSGSTPDSNPCAAQLYDGDPTTTERLDVETPVEAGVAISQTRFPTQRSPHVVLARNDVFADSLAGSALTAAGPLLFTSPDTLTGATRNEIGRVLVPGGTVYLLGGEHALSPLVEAAVTAIGYRPHRLAGSTRIETAIAIADEVLRLNPEQRLVALARSAGLASDPTSAWADAIAAGGWLAYRQVPLLLTPTEALNPAVADWLTKAAPHHTILLGGAQALSPHVEGAIASPWRVAGAARDATAVAINHQLWAAPRTRFILINAYHPQGWALGLAAAGISADVAAPILPTSASALPPATHSQLSACSSPWSDTLILASESLIDQGVQQQVDALDGQPC